MCGFLLLHDLLLLALHGCKEHVCCLVLLLLLGKGAHGVGQGIGELRERDWLWVWCNIGGFCAEHAIYEVIDTVEVKMGLCRGGRAGHRCLQMWREMAEKGTRRAATTVDRSYRMHRHCSITRRLEWLALLTILHGIEGLRKHQGLKSLIVTPSFLFLYLSILTRTTLPPRKT